MDQELNDAIQEDLNSSADQENREKLSSFEKMSKSNLAKQDKKLLIAFCESKGLLNGYTERQKERLNRKELAELIKPTQKRAETGQKSTNEDQGEQEIEKYKNAFFGIQAGDYSHADNLAQNNILVFINEGVSGGEVSERTLKILSGAKLVLSGVYLIVRFTGGFSAWGDRIKNVAIKIKEKVKAKKNV